MNRVMLTIAYDGTQYHGYQIQDGVKTIEGEVSKALFELTGNACELIGGSRTDAGVHALSNVAVFDTNSSIPAEKFAYALNPHLPEDIKIVSSVLVPDDFHPRHCATTKTYEYHIYNAKFPDPTKRLYSHFSYTPYDLEAMRQAAKYMEGEHDFTSFCTVGAQVDSKVRTIYSVDVVDNKYNYVNRNSSEDVSSDFPRDIIIRVKGNGFLYNMVRIIAGTLMEVGAGRIKPTDIPAIIDGCDRALAGPTAPACGLTLMKFEFDE